MAPAFRFCNPIVVGGLILAALLCSSNFANFAAAAPVAEGVAPVETASSSGVVVSALGQIPEMEGAVPGDESAEELAVASEEEGEEEEVERELEAVTSSKVETRSDAAAGNRNEGAADAASTAAPTGNCNAKLSVMNYNTRQLPKFLLFNDWDQDSRLKRLPQVLRQPEYQADILILEELMTEAAYNKVHELSDIYPYITTVVGKDCSGKDLNSITGPCSKILPRSGVMALSKLPILETHGLIYKYAAAGTWDAKCNKGAIYLKLSINGLNVHVVGTHLQADEGDVDGGPTRVLQMQHLREWMRTFPIPKEEPIILAGDINTQLGTEEQHSIFDGNFVFNFVKHDFGTFSASTNWLTRADAYVSKTSIYAEKHLDYIATWTHHLQPIRPAYMTILKLKAKEKWYWSYLEGWWILHEGPYHHDGYYNDVSDHYPVVATFEFPVQSCPAPQETNALESDVILLSS